MLSPKFDTKKNQQQSNTMVTNHDPYNSTMTLNTSTTNTYRPQNQQQYNTTSRFTSSQSQQLRRNKDEPQISVSQANLNQKNESGGFFGTLGRKKKAQEGELNAQQPNASIQCETRLTSLIS